MESPSVTRSCDSCGSAERAVSEPLRAFLLCAAASGRCRAGAWHAYGRSGYRCALSTRVGSDRYVLDPTVTCWIRPSLCCKHLWHRTEPLPVGSETCRRRAAWGGSKERRRGDAAMDSILFNSSTGLLVDDDVQCKHHSIECCGVSSSRVNACITTQVKAVCMSYHLSPPITAPLHTASFPHEEFATKILASGENRLGI
jgi:hypothetical protein